MYAYMLATSTQHYTEGFSQLSKVRKEKKKKRKGIKIGKEEEKLFLFSD